AAHGKTIRLWDAATGQSQAELVRHKLLITGLAFSPDGKWLASSAGDPNPFNPAHELLLWDTGKGDVSADLMSGRGSGAACVAIAPDGKTLAVGRFDGKIQLFDLAARRQTAELPGHTGRASGLAFLPDGQTLASSGHDETVRLWDLTAKKEKAVLRGHE